jgi:hypothetical protein
VWNHRTIESMLGSLVTIWPRARRAFVRIKTGGASKATSTTFKMGRNKPLRLCTLPTSSERRSIYVASCSELQEGSTRRASFNKNAYPGSKISAEDSNQTSQSEDLTLDAKEMRLWFGREPLRLVATPRHCFSVETSSCPQIAPVSSLAL